MGSLAQVLRTIPSGDDPNLLVGLSGSDDAGVYRLSEWSALVQTVDFFPPLVDDPCTFGRIAAANSLSDVYAMGGRPITCLNIVGFPDDKLPLEVLVEILRGGQEKITEAGATLVGGHSVRDAEVKYGLAVTGLIDPKRIITNTAAKPGDCLVLTKPLGSGILTTAYKKDFITETDLQECITTMSRLNKSACQAMLEFDVHAATDITGFGLLGHAYEMAAASQVTLTIEASKVPLMEHVLNLAEKGCFNRAVGSNLAGVADRLDRGRMDEIRIQILADPQTSGGLLISLGADQTDGLIAGLRRNGDPSACVIGRVQAASEHTLVLR